MFMRLSKLLVGKSPDICISVFDFHAQDNNLLIYIKLRKKYPVGTAGLYIKHLRTTSSLQKNVL